MKPQLSERKWGVQIPDNKDAFEGAACYFWCQTCRDAPSSLSLPWAALEAAA